VGLAEILTGEDFHAENQKRYKFPEGKDGRDLAKTFLYRMIFKGPAYAYANDPRFMGVSSSEKFWQKIIDTTYEKYSGLARWHTEIIQEVNATGQLSIPTGRVYEFKRTLRGDYSERDITCYPVQGLESELMAIVRVTARNRYPKFHLKDRMLFVNTVHDSVVVDADAKEGSKELEEICIWLEDLFLDVPKNFERVYGSKLNVPMQGECKYGPNWADMKKFKRGEK
jgi:DNA polymerase I-like protein with 3'-5' exonuclease and polymerase domains